MKSWIAFWNILGKDMRSYYLKPPNVSWGLIFPLAWTGVFFIRSGSRLDSVAGLLPGVIAVSVLFGTTSLLAPIPLELLMLAKTAGAILFGVVNAFVPVVLAALLIDLAGVDWSTLIPAVVLIAVSVSEVFEAQTLSNFFRFPMVFLYGLFFPIEQLPVWLRPLSYILPLTYGADALHGSIRHAAVMPLPLDFALLAAFCVVLFAVSLLNIKKKWIL